MQEATVEVEFTPKQIRAIRESLGLTQTQAAERCGVKLRTWQHWEMGDRAPRGAANLVLRQMAETAKTEGSKK